MRGHAAAAVRRPRDRATKCVSEGGWAPADDMQDKKAEVFRAMPPASPQHCVRGQYEGYTDTPGVAPGSAAET